MNDQTIYWVWLQQALGYAANKIIPVLCRYTFAEEFYSATIKEKLLCADFSLKQRRALENISLQEAEAIINRCKKCGIEIVTPNDEAYPERLSDIPNPPAALYVKGSMEVLNSDLPVAIVGTRNMTVYGKRHTFNFAYGMAKNGVTVISGGALGVDSTAHNGALQAGGLTVCVLGCGIESGYLRDNKPLRELISTHGALVSEYPPDYPASRYTFPARNRIISGLSKGVLVVEAGERSGALITANLALEQNRDVFAVPGDIASPYSKGPNALINQGAKAVTDFSEVLSEYIPEDTIKSVSPQAVRRTDPDCYSGEKENKHSERKDRRNKAYSKNNAANEIHKESVICKKITREQLTGLSKNAQKVMNLFFKEKEMYSDSITELSGLSAGEVSAAVTELEMNGFVTPSQGRKYKAEVEL